jgi:hypothetical protein
LVRVCAACIGGGRGGEVEEVTVGVEDEADAGMASSLGNGAAQ